MLRGIDGELAERIKTIARDRKWALNDVILHLLRQALGPQAAPPTKNTYVFCKKTDFPGFWGKRQANRATC